MRSGLAAWVASLVLLSGCVGGSGGGGGPIAPGECVGDCGAAPSGGGDKAADLGDFVPVYEPAMRLAALQQDFQNNRFLETITESLNGALRLPHDVYIVSAECGAVNAFWVSDRSAIVMCLELVNYLVTDLFPRLYGNPDVVDEAVGAFLFIFLHELGHALIDVYELPVLGRGEDAADGFAAVRTIASGNIGPLAYAADFFAATGEVSQAAFADEHGLGQQRAYNLVCWAYGSNTQEYAWLVPTYLPQDRAVRCPDEYQSLNRDWEGLLARYRQ